MSVNALKHSIGQSDVYGACIIEKMRRVCGESGSEGIVEIVNERLTTSLGRSSSRAG